MSEVVKEEYKFSASLDVVTFEQFLALIPSESTTLTVQTYNRQVSYGGLDESGELEDSVYVRNAVVVQEPTKNNLLAQILDQVALGAYAGTEQDRIEAAAHDSLDNFGVPTHVVKLTSNLYGVFGLEDFKYRHIGPAQGCVLCYRTVSNIVFRVMD